MQDNIPEMQRIIWLSELAQAGHVPAGPAMTAIHLRLKRIIPAVTLTQVSIAYESQSYESFAVYTGLDPNDQLWDLYALGDVATMLAAAYRMQMEQMELSGLFALLRHQPAPSPLGEPAEPCHRMLGLIQATPIRLATARR